MQVSEFKENVLDVVRKDSEREEKYQLEGNGWEIMKPEYFVEMGFDERLVKTLTDRTYSGEGKHALYDNDGNSVPYIDGVYYLNFLETCARIVEPNWGSDKMGRGYRAREALSAMKEAAHAI
jgi:hypothetical protein